MVKALLILGVNIANCGTLDKAIRYINESCSENSLEQADYCAFNCDNTLLQCLLACDGDNTCVRACSSTQEDCLNNCPCHTLCPNGCPCDQFTCQTCEELHAEDIVACDDRCFHDSSDCETNCKNNCQNDCESEPDHAICLDNCNYHHTCCTADCPCYTGTDGDICYDADFRDIMYDIPAQFLDANGFKQYLKVKADAGAANLPTQMYPPDGTTEIFIGCGKDVNNIIQLGAVMPPDELFRKRRYDHGRTDQAHHVKDFYTYYSSTEQEPIGFSKDRNIHLNDWDRHDCTGNPYACRNWDEHRLSVLTDHDDDYNLYRCGEFNRYDEDGFQDSFYLVMYHK